MEKQGDRMIYLDNCATTKPRSEVVEAMMKVLTDNFGNPSSLHSLGLDAEKMREESRKSIAKIINASAKEIYFTSGGTEDNNIAIHGLIKKNKRFGNKIIMSCIEHASIRDQINSYKDKGYDIVEISVDRNGNLNEDELINQIDDKTIVLSLQHVNNELGTINNVAEIIKKAKSKNKNLLVHVDGVQAFGKIPVDVKEINCDTYSMSGHKVYGPKGIGALYIKNSLSIDSLVIGGGQEKGLRSGTENMPGIVGFGVAAKILYERFDEETKHAEDIKEYLISEIENNFTDFEFNQPNNSSPYVVSVSFADIRAEVLLHYLEQDEIYISTASACTSNGTHKSHVLQSIGLSPKLAEGTIRICTSKDINKEDIDIFIKKLKEYVEDIRLIMKR